MERINVIFSFFGDPWIQLQWVLVASVQATKHVLLWLDIAVRKNWESHIDASHSRQPLVKGERLVRYEVNAVMH